MEDQDDTESQKVKKEAKGELYNIPNGLKCS